jgi:hypothetical protein
VPHFTIKKGYTMTIETMEKITNALNALATLLGAVGGFIAGIRALRKPKKGKVTENGLVKDPTFIVGIALIGLAIVFLIGGRVTSIIGGKPTPTSTAPLPTETYTPVPPSTFTPIPNDTATPTSPHSVWCKNPSVTQEVFPQLQSVSNQFPFYGPLNDPNFVCQEVFDKFHDDTTHSSSASVRIEYSGTNDGYWGISMPDGYNASAFNEICFWAYAEQPAQAFKLKMKDKRKTSHSEEGVPIIVAQVGVWQPFCTPLSKFSNLGVDLSQLENVNLGFEQFVGPAAVWVDDFEFKK